MHGQEVVINAAGNVNDGDRFVDLIGLLVNQAETVMGAGGRLWLFAGAAVLDVPNRDIMGIDLPKVPAQFSSHKTNYELVRATSLNWSMLCPGPMIPATDGKARSDLRLSIEVWPFGRPDIIK